MTSFNFNQNDSEDSEATEEQVLQMLRQAGDTFETPSTDYFTESSEDDEDDLQLEDVDRRIEVANLYRALLKGGGLFDQSSSASKIVEKRIGNFVKTELRILLGMDKPPQPTAVAPPLFSPDEVDILKSIAAKLTVRVNNPAEAKPVNAQPAPTPVLRKTQLPPPKQTIAKSPTPPAKVVARPSTPKPAPPVVKPKAKEHVAAKDGTILKEEDGKRTVKKGGRIIKQILDDSGQVTSERDVTPQVRPADAIQPLSASELEMVYHRQAMQTEQASFLNQSKDETMIKGAIRG